MLMLPDDAIGLGNGEVAEADRFVDWDFDLQIVAGCEGNFFVLIFGNEDEFLDEGGDVVVADNAELVCLWRRAPGPPG
jgi:hypothetical protein